MRLPNVPRTKLVQYDYCVVNQDWIGSKIVNIDLELPPISGAAPLPPIYSYSVEAPQNTPPQVTLQKKVIYPKDFLQAVLIIFSSKFPLNQLFFFKKFAYDLRYSYIYWYIVYLIL